MTRYLLSVCVYSLYPASNAHAPYCHLWPARLHNIFPYYLIHDTIYEEKNVIEHKMCFYFLYNVCLRYFSFWEELGEIWSKIFVFVYRHPCSCLILMKIELPWMIFEKMFKYQISWKSVHWEPSCSMRDRRTDKRTVTTEMIVAFRNFAEAPRNCTGVGAQVTFILGVPLPLQPETYHRDRSYGDGEEGGGAGGGGMLERRKQFPAVEKQKRRKLLSTILNTSCTLRVRTMFLLRWFLSQRTRDNKREK